VAESRAGLHSDTPFGQVENAALRQAAIRVAEGWPEGPGDARREEISDLLIALTAMVAERKNGRLSSADPHLSSDLGRGLLERLRAEMIRGWHEEADALPAASSMLADLRALEEVRESIAHAWADHSPSILSGPVGLDLVVEMAHDLRSPLTSILFLSETLQRGLSGEVNDLQHRQLGLIYGAALRLNELASDVLELARGGNGLADDEVSPISLSEVFESVHEIVRPIAEEKGLTVRSFPPLEDSRLGHPLPLNRVLLNLTTNALKFTEEGFVELVAHTKGTNVVEFSVRDTGRGIQPEALRTLYQPFRRARGGAGYAFSGTGLGLAICRTLVEALDSELHVETRPGWGTRFFFELDLPHVPGSAGRLSRESS
jgi:signal transduction histidine kinase